MFSRLMHKYVEDTLVFCSVLFNDESQFIVMYSSARGRKESGNLSRNHEFTHVIEFGS